jgi:hypothetical protein
LVYDSTVAIGPDCWDPLAANAAPFPWFPSSLDPWEQTCSVFFKSNLVENPFSGKEKSQLMDLHEDWGTKIVNDIWNWNNSFWPPLRFLVEFVLLAAVWSQAWTLEHKEKSIGPTSQTPF